MNILGIIAEYNPFHNGHLHHLLQAKKQTGADYVIVVMSGDYVQRGAPAIYHKYLRAKMALSAGADLVLELPSLFAVSSAADFAGAAVALIDQLGVVSHLCFGSECGNIRLLAQTARLLSAESEEFQRQLKLNLKAGMTFPAARSATVKVVGEPKEVIQVLETPNNILGIEYLKALTKRKSPIKPITIKRQGNGYHDEGFDGAFISASAIRKMVEQQAGFKKIKDKLPPHVYPYLQTECPVLLNDFSLMLQLSLLEKHSLGQSFSDYLDVSTDLANRITRQLPEFLPFDQRIARLKSRQYTFTRISRACLHILLGITHTQLEQAKAMDYVPYARVLGFQKKALPLLKAVKVHSTIPLISKTANAHKFLSPDANALLEQTIYHSHLYQSVYTGKCRRSFLNDYTAGCIRV